MLALLHKACLVDDQHAVRIAQRFDDISANIIPQRFFVAKAADEERLHAIGASEARLFGHLPAGLARNPRQETVQKGARRRLQLLASQKIGAKRAFSADNSASQSSATRRTMPQSPSPTSPNHFGK